VGGCSLQEQHPPSPLSQPASKAPSHKFVSRASASNALESTGCMWPQTEPLQDHEEFQPAVARHPASQPANKPPSPEDRRVHAISVPACKEYVAAPPATGTVLTIFHFIVNGTSPSNSQGPRWVVGAAPPGPISKVPARQPNQPASESASMPPGPEHTRTRPGNTLAYHLCATCEGISPLSSKGDPAPWP